MRAVIAAVALAWATIIVMPSKGSALPLAPAALLEGLQAFSDVIEVKGGRGFKPRGWSKGRKVGWRGGGCPPGLRKQGRC